MSLQKKQRAAPRLGPHLQRVTRLCDLAIAIQKCFAQCLALLDDLPQPGPLCLLQLSELSIHQQRAALTQQARHQLGKGLTETRLGRIPITYLIEPVAIAFARNRTAEIRQGLGYLVSQRA